MGEYRSGLGLAIDDDGVSIQQLRTGVGAHVLLANGFLSQSVTGWDRWKRAITERYPGHPVSRVRWEAQVLESLKPLENFLDTGGDPDKLLAEAKRQLAKPLAALREISRIDFSSPGVADPDVTGSDATGSDSESGTAVAAGQPSPDVVSQLLSKVGQVAKHIPTPVPAVVIEAPAKWFAAKQRATDTGLALAEAIKNTPDDETFILAGFSLGARVMATAALTLAEQGIHHKLEAVYLIGAAISRSDKWKPITEAVTQGVWNYWSRNDSVLSTLYRIAEGGATPFGLAGSNLDDPKMHDVDVSSEVFTHRGYLPVISFATI